MLLSYATSAVRSCMCFPRIISAVTVSGSFLRNCFFSPYWETNRYLETEVFLADLRNPRVWYEVAAPANGGRAEITSKSPVYVMCRTVKRFDSPHENIQQSDYIQLWNNAGTRTNEGNLGARLKMAVVNRYWLYRFVLAVRGTLRDRLQRMRSPTALSNRNRYLKKRLVSDLLTG